MNRTDAALKPAIEISRRESRSRLRQIDDKLRDEPWRVLRLQSCGLQVSQNHNHNNAVESLLTRPVWKALTAAATIGTS